MFKYKPHSCQHTQCVPVDLLVAITRFQIAVLAIFLDSILTKILAKSKSEAPPATKDTKEKKVRRKRDANAPKKPVCAFFWYQRDPKN